MNRVVITGLGLVTPLGVGVSHSWKMLLEGGCGVVRLTAKEYEKFPSQVAALVPEGTGPNQFNRDGFSSSEWRQMSKCIAFALVAAKEALTDAAWSPETEEQRETTGVAIGTGMVDLMDVCETGNLLTSRGYSKVSPYFVPRILPNMSAGHVSIRHKLRGPNHCVSTACSTGAHSVGDAFVMIKRNQAKVMVCGGTEASVSPLGVAGFCRLRALSTNFNETPSLASRPFDAQRDGFVIGEGAGILILEEIEHARRRNAKIYAEVLGYGLSGDGFHLTSPDKDGRGAFLCMKRALEEANLFNNPAEIGYINAHATSTPLGDEVESRAVDRLMSNKHENLVVSSTKGATGHLLGAAGAVEAIFTILSVYNGKIPPNLNLNKSDINLNLNYATKTCDWPNNPQRKRRIALSNSFGFGGTNVSLCFANFL